MTKDKVIALCIWAPVLLLYVILAPAAMILGVFCR